MMFSLLFTKSITDLVEWLKKQKKYHYDLKIYHITFLYIFILARHILGKGPSDSPPPCMHISLQSKQQVSEQPLVHW